MHSSHSQPRHRALLLGVLAGGMAVVLYDHLVPTAHPVIAAFLGALVSCSFFALRRAYAASVLRRVPLLPETYELAAGGLIGVMLFFCTLALLKDGFLMQTAPSILSALITSTALFAYSILDTKHPPPNIE